MLAAVIADTHLPRGKRRLPDAFNPGSPTEHRRAPTHTMGLARIGAGGVTFELVEV